MLIALHLIIIALYRIVSFTLTLLFALAAIDCYSQFKTKSILTDSTQHTLTLEYETVAFFKNNEYIPSPTTRGFTGIGIWLQPMLTYKPTPTTKISNGIFLLQYADQSGATRILPRLTIQQKLTKRLDLVMGSLYGSLNHGLEEPLFRVDRYYQNHVEYGVQFLYDSDRFTSDIWINWEKFIEKNDPIQEAFVAGVTSNWKIIDKSWDVSLPLQLMATHNGGEIDTSLEPVVSTFNGLVGLSVGKSLSTKDSVTLSTLALASKTLTDQNTGGNAIYLKLDYKHNWLRAMLGYWNAIDFLAPRGEYLFLSNSEFEPNVYVKKRELLTAKLSVNYAFSKDTQLRFGVDGYYDLDTSELSYSYGVYLVIRDSWKIAQLKSQ